MKKIISYILLLAMAVAMFAGCAPKEDANLNAAAEYLYAMYKDGKTTTDSDYTVVGQVRINDVTYPITWTSDKADNVQIVAGENNMATVKITAAEEDINYKLTATMKNEDGLEVSVSFDRIIPAKAQVGGTIVLAYPKENKFISGSHYLYTGKNKWQLNLTENEAEAIALEVVDNGDGSVTFKAGEYFLFCDATHVQFVKEQSDNTKFVLEAADTDGGYFIKCAVANYGGKAQYLEVYSGYLTCYGMGSDPSIYTFKLQETTTAAGTVSGLEGDSAPEADPTDPPANDNSNDPAADSTLSIADAIALGASKAHNTYTENKYYVTGEITEVYNEQYGNMKIKDASGNILTIYGTYDATGANRYDAMATKPVAGDTVTVYGIIGQYNDTPQLKNGWITAHTPAAGSSNPPATEPPATNPPATEPPVTNPPATEPPATNTGSSNVNGKLAASIDLKGTTTLTSVSATQTVHTANGITYTNDKASSTTDNYASQSKYAARAYKSSTVKIEYTGMVAIVLHLDDYESNGKTYMAGFDGMTVSGATITRDGTVVTIVFANPTNVFLSAELASQTRINSIDVYTAN